MNCSSTYWRFGESQGGTYNEKLVKIIGLASLRSASPVVRRKLQREAQAPCVLGFYAKFPEQAQKFDIKKARYVVPSFSL